MKLIDMIEALPNLNNDQLRVLVVMAVDEYNSRFAKTCFDLGEIEIPDYSE